MRNVESRLSMVPRANISRSKFDMTPFRHLTTMNAGKLVPIFVQECLPAGTYSLTVKDLIRMSTPIHPVMDDCYLDTYFFFVPNRLVWDNWEEFMGENKSGYWTKNNLTYTVPQIYLTTDVLKGSILDYMGIPTNVRNMNEGLSINALPVRGYCLIWNEWFRDQNTMEPLHIDTTSRDFLNSPLTGNYFNTATCGGDLLPVAKFHDYFTSALPEPQRGPDVSVPLSGDMIPVKTGAQTYDVNLIPMTWSPAEAGSHLDPTVSHPILAYGSEGITLASSNLGSNPSVPLAPNNLYGDLSEAVSATINELRLAVALQSFYEASARYGGRYTELLRGHFGVVSPDSRLQRPEYIGGKRVKINMQQVLQTSATNEVSPQGNTAAFSLTADIDKSFTYSCVEHGFIIGVCCIRTRQTYQYGLHRMWSRLDMTDYYFPEFAHIGEQPLLNKEIFLTGTDTDNEVFGYQEAWAEYRQNHSYVTGAYRSNYAQSLDSWHYAEKLEDLPTLSAEFMQQSTNVIDRTLAVSSAVEDQFLCDFEFDMSVVLPMPMYSVPGFGLRF